MEGWQARIFLEAQAEIVRVEGMKAENSNRERRGETQAYTEYVFFEVADDIQRMAREIGEC